MAVRALRYPAFTGEQQFFELSVTGTALEFKYRHGLTTPLAWADALGVEYRESDAGCQSITCGGFVGNGYPLVAENKTPPE